MSQTIFWADSLLLYDGCSQQHVLADAICAAGILIEWSMVRVDAAHSLPPQRDGINCGLFVTLFAKALTERGELTLLEHVSIQDLNLHRAVIAYEFVEREQQL